MIMTDMYYASHGAVRGSILYTIISVSPGKKSTRSL